MKRMMTAFGLAAVSTSLWALPPVGASLPSPGGDDTETSTNVVFSATQDRMGEFCFSLSCLATPSNNVQIAFGAAEGESCDLAIGDADCIVGWDCGSWFVQNGADGTRLESASTTTNEVKTLSWRMTAKPRGLRIREEGGGDLFPDLPEAALDWAYRPTWNRMRLTGRGVGPLRERFSVQVLPDSLAIFFR